MFLEGGRKEGVLLVIGTGRGREEEGLLGILGWGGWEKERDEREWSGEKKEEGIIGEDWGRVGLGKMKGVIGDGGGVLTGEKGFGWVGERWERKRKEWGWEKREMVYL